MTSGPLRLGCVAYLNARPLIHGWAGPVEFDHPSSLCVRLARGELDVALVSSFEFLRAPVYRIVDEVAIASHGAVRSVFLAHQCPLEEIETIVLDPASLTSANLLRCLLAERNLRPRLLQQSEGEHAREAQLMIGDQALRFRAHEGASFAYWDLGEEWKSQTGLPFVFALWLIRPEVAEADATANALRARRDQNLATLEDVIASQTDFPADFARFYFRECLHFGLGDAEKAGLLRFRSVCEKHGLLTAKAAPLPLV